MKKIVAALGLALPAFSANATYIVDTGLGATGTNWSLTVDQYFGGKFTTTEPYDINSIEAGDITVYDGGQITVAINRDASNVPGVTLISQTFSVFATGNYNLMSWIGAYNVGYRLDPGSYWVTIKPGLGVNAGMIGVATNPLEHYAVGNSDSWIRGNYDFVKVAFRVDGTPHAPSASVPEPSSETLSGIAVIGLIFARKRKRV